MSAASASGHSRAPIDDQSVGCKVFQAMITQLWHYTVSDGVPKRSLLVALVIGTILNLINQGDALVTGAALNTSKLLLTYLVPYCVSTYGAVSFRLHAARAPHSRGEQLPGKP